jgi:hypothetical protein
VNGDRSVETRFSWRRGRAMSAAAVSALCVIALMTACSRQPSPYQDASPAEDHDASPGLDVGGGPDTGGTLTIVTLAIMKSGDGDGVVMSLPSGLDCGAQCTITVPAGTAVTFTAVAGPTSMFMGWIDGPCTGTASCTITANANTTMNARFATMVRLTVRPTGNGEGIISSVPAGISCGMDCDELYPSGTVVTLTATSTTGRFAGWRDSGCSGTGDCVVTITADTTVSATFTTCPPSTSTIYRFSGAVATYTVPACVNSITIDAYGAQGMSAGGAGGFCGRATGTLAVVSGQVLFVNVGGMNGFNGGGPAAGGGPVSGNGGGASDVRTVDGDLGTRLIVAGGGGGGGGAAVGICAPGAPGIGAVAGGLNGHVGTTGSGCLGQGSGGSGGMGGTAIAGGAGGISHGNCSTIGDTGGAGSAGLGGSGGAGALGDTCGSGNHSNGGGGGGGGGGFYGGGGGGGGAAGSDGSFPGGGGGGGSSYFGGVSGGSTVAGVRAGDGMIIISF